VSLKVGDTNNANNATATENTAEPHETYIDNLDTSIYQPWGFEISSILYSINQLADLNL